jgi:hypothetical protein
MQSNVHQFPIAHPPPCFLLTLQFVCGQLSGSSRTLLLAFAPANIRCASAEQKVPGSRKHIKSRKHTCGVFRWLTVNGCDLVYRHKVEETCDKVRRGMASTNSSTRKRLFILSLSSLISEFNVKNENGVTMELHLPNSLFK